MYKTSQILAELDQQINLACKNYIEPMRMMADVLVSGPTFEDYVRMLELLNGTEDVNKLKSELEDAIQKSGNKVEFSTMEKRLILEYSQYATSSLFPDQKVLDEITSMIKCGMALFFYPLDLEGCSQELKIKYSQNRYKIPDLDIRLRKEAKNYIKSEFDDLKGCLDYPDLENVMKEILGETSDQNMYK